MPTWRRLPFCLLALLAVASAGAAPRRPVDSYGDPLPDGAVARLGTSRLCHQGAFALVFAPDGKALASLADDGSVRHWEVATGKELAEARLPRFLGYSTGGTLLAFSADGKMLAVAGPDQAVHVFDVPGLRERHRFPARGVSVLAFAPGRGLLAAGSYDGAISLYDAAAGRPVREWEAGTASSALAFSADGKKLLTAGYHKGPVPVQEWEAATGKLLREQAVKGATSYPMRFTPDGRLLVTSDTASRALGLWACAAGGAGPRLEQQPQSSGPLAFSVDGRALAHGDGDGVFRLWATDTGKLLRQLPAPGGRIWQVALSPDGKVLASVNRTDHAVHLWDVARGRELHTFAGHRSGPLAIAFAPDGKTIRTASRDGAHSPGARSWAPWSLRRWDARSGKELRAWTPDLGGEAHWAAFSPCGRFLAVGVATGTLRLLDAAAGGEVRHWQLPTQVVTERWEKKVLRKYPSLGADAFTAAIGPDGDRLLTAGRSAGYILWDVTAGKEVRRFPGPSEGAYWCAFSPDGRTLALAEWFGASSRAYLLDSQTGKQVRELQGLRPPITKLAFAPDGRSLAVSLRGDFTLWEVASGRLRCHIVGAAEWTFALAFSPHGRLLASGGRDGTVRLWDAATGRLLHRFQGHRSDVVSLAFSPDGRLLASASYDNVALVWDVAGIKPVVARAPRPEDLPGLWAALAQDDAVKAYGAIQRLADGAALTVPFLARELAGGAPPVDARHVAALVADLDSDRFAVREKAAAGLILLREPAREALRKVLTGNPSAELRRRAERLLQAMGSPEDEVLRELRAVEVLERVGSTPARNVLQELARSGRAAAARREARAALGRLARRAVPEP
jgi:WD40 repeat protein